jgi:hypothetical protein
VTDPVGAGVALAHRDFDGGRPRSFDAVHKDIDALRMGLEARLENMPDGGTALAVQSFEQDVLLSEVEAWLVRAEKAGHCGAESVWATLCSADARRDMRLRWLLLDAAFVRLIGYIHGTEAEAELITPLHLWLKTHWGLAVATVRATVAAQLKIIEGQEVPLEAASRNLDLAAVDSRLDASMAQASGAQARADALVAEASHMQYSVTTPEMEERAHALRKAVDAAKAYAYCTGALHVCVKSGPDAIDASLRTGLSSADGVEELRQKALSLGELYVDREARVSTEEGQKAVGDFLQLIELLAMCVNEGPRSVVESLTPASPEESGSEESSTDDTEGDRMPSLVVLQKECSLESAVAEILLAARDSGLFESISTDPEAKHLLALFQEFSEFVLIEKDAMIVDVDGFLVSLYRQYDRGPRWQMVLGVGATGGAAWRMEPPEGADALSFPVIYSEKIGIKFNSVRGEHTVVHHAFHVGGLLYALASAAVDNSANPFESCALLGMDAVGINYRRSIEMNLTLQAFAPVFGGGDWAFGAGINLAVPLLDYFEELSAP